MKPQVGDIAIFYEGASEKAIFGCVKQVGENHIAVGTKSKTIITELGNIGDDVLAGEVHVISREEFIKMSDALIKRRRKMSRR